MWIVIVLRVWALMVLSLVFIKDFWMDLKDDIMRFIRQFHRNGKLTKGINYTFIELIPKVDCPQKLSDFRPISLVGSVTP